MVSSMKINCHLAIAVVPLLLVHSSTAFFSSSKAKGKRFIKGAEHWGSVREKGS